MNKANQIHKAEHELKQIPGNTVVACRKKRKTCAHKSVTDKNNESEYESYVKPSNFEQFVSQLNDACNDGEQAAKKVIEELAPDIAKT